MSWSISGTVEVVDGMVNTENLFWSPAKEEMTDGPLDQANFLLSTVEAAAEQELIDGWYSVSLVGHWPSEDQTGAIAGRKTISLSFAAIEAPATSEPGNL